MASPPIAGRLSPPTDTHFPHVGQRVEAGEVLPFVEPPLPATDAAQLTANRAWIEALELEIATRKLDLDMKTAEIERAVRAATARLSAYLSLVAARELRRIAQENLELATKSHATVTAQREAGAASLLDENLARGQALTADLGVRRARLDAANAKKHLARLMSLADNVDDIVLSDPMPGGFDVSLHPHALIALAPSTAPKWCRRPSAISSSQRLPTRRVRQTSSP